LSNRVFFLLYVSDYSENHRPTCSRSAQRERGIGSATLDERNYQKFFSSLMSTDAILSGDPFGPIVPPILRQRSLRERGQGNYGVTFFLMPPIPTSRFLSLFCSHPRPRPFNSMHSVDHEPKSIQSRFEVRQPPASPPPPLVSFFPSPFLARGPPPESH